MGKSTASSISFNWIRFAAPGSPLKDPSKDVPRMCVGEGNSRASENVWKRSKCETGAGSDPPDSMPGTATIMVTSLSQTSVLWGNSPVRIEDRAAAQRGWVTKADSKRAPSLASRSVLYAETQVRDARQTPGYAPPLREGLAGVQNLSTPSPHGFWACRIQNTSEY